MKDIDTAEVIKRAKTLSDRFLWPMAPLVAMVDAVGCYQRIESSSRAS
jgi:hypothetical protein